MLLGRCDAGDVVLAEGPGWALRIGAATATAVLLGEAPRIEGAALAGHDDPPGTGWLVADRVLSHSGPGLPWRCALGDRDGVPLASVALRVDGDTVVVEIAAEGPSEATALAQRFVASDGERFCGFGERSDHWLLERGIVEHYVGEGPFQPEEYELIALVIPPWALRQRADATYFPMPWVLSTDGYGVLVDNDELGYARVRTESPAAWSVEAAASRLRWRYLPGPTPIDVLGRLGRRVGRQPAPERWWFGPWYQTGHDDHVPLEEERRQLAALVAAGAAASAAETHCRYLPLGADRGREDAERARIEHFHGEGLAVLSYLSAFCGREDPDAWDDAEGCGGLQRGPHGGAYSFDGYVGARQPPVTALGQYDFAGPGGGPAWGRAAARVVAAGYDGWMEDFGEYTPLDAAGADGSVGTAAHNRYATRFHEAATAEAAALEQRAGRRLARLVRSGWTGTAAVAPIVWGGDPTCGWGFDGLSSAVVEMLSMAASGVSMWGSDTGGFFSGRQQLSPELLIRWIQLSAFCPVMRTKSSGVELPSYRRPQIWDDDVLPHWARWSVWHTRLNDYLIAAHAVYRRTGRPLACPLPLLEAGLPGGELADEWLLGNDLLVAPVLAPGATERAVTFPSGRWVDLWHPERPIITGPCRVTVPVTLEDIPVWVRAGAVLALLPCGVRSVSPYAPPVPDERELWITPDQPWSGALGPGLTAAVHKSAAGWDLAVEAERPVDLRLVVRCGRGPVQLRQTYRQ